MNSRDVVIAHRTARTALIALRLQQFDLVRYGRTDEATTVAEAADALEAAIAGQGVPR